jgi:membrane-associated protease RseP (regulator of RpoE activity)
MVVERQFKDLVRVQTVARPILKGSAELCGEKVYPSVGVFAANAYDFAGEYHQAARDYGLGEQIRVIAVIPNSPAANAGLAVGDTITAVESWPVPTGKKATATTLARLRKELEADARVTLTVDRQGQVLPMPLEAETLCDFQVVVQPSDDVNAFADGKAV